ncbi:MAG TPA: cytochrome c biogenesis protein CcsA [bacterium]|nr:cytochrome c biogenesis protein CcsA [bacterium]
MKKLSSALFPVLPAAAFLLLTAAYYLIFVYSPEEVNQGLVQKLFYFHVSCAFAMYCGFSLAGLFALLYLIKRKSRFDRLSHAGASVGLLFCTMVLASGPVWAKPIWGTWWTWDPRLTTTLLIWLIFFACLLLRRFFEGDPRGPVYAAVVTLFGLLDLPLISLSVRLWRGVHPSVLGKKENMPVEMKITLLVTNLAVLLLFISVYWVRARLLGLEHKSELLSVRDQEGR